MGSVLALGNGSRGGAREGEIERMTTKYNDVVVRRARDRVDIEVEGATFATWHPRHLLTGYSWDALTAACLLRADAPPKTVLLLGLGGGTVARQLRLLIPQMRIVGVEIDDGIVRLARKHMALDTLGVEVVHDDAYAYLARTKERFDAVVDDLFLTGPEDVVRARAPVGDTLELLTKRAAPGGVVIANLITDKGHDDLQRSARRAFLARFASVRSVTPPRGLNEVLVGGDATLPRSGLDGYREAFEEQHDRTRWAEIGVRLMRRHEKRATKA